MANINLSYPDRAISVAGDVLNPEYFPRLVKATADFGMARSTPSSTISVTPGTVSFIE